MFIVEDGSSVLNAESYATTEKLISYAGKFDMIIPADLGAQEALLRRPLPVAPARPNATQFADCLQNHGLFAVRV
ncbi:DnaT-like ssDNA-binding protein [Pseudomonas sp. RIT-PI-a]|uniref:DnaT-like ssDNA-binding protein n=1 Tax=Pseudomonas sp. RIT-PI-a TaxID=1681194 RepID=UPI0006760003|nr:DnaT-like ssDNA-binding protein [Pseudomonas sp. RIT-PI-a]KNC16562.1 hypothetical protein AC788_03205 [Pseudomonas sp. RIT-PI-a]